MPPASISIIRIIAVTNFCIFFIAPFTTCLVDCLRGCVGDGRARGIHADEREFLFVGERRVKKRLHAVVSGRWEFDVEKEAYVVCDAAGRDLEERRLGENDGVLAVLGQYSDFGKMTATPAPLADDGELQDGHRKLVDCDLMEHAHQREL